MSHNMRKPRVLRKNNVRRKTGAKAQSKQINALSRQVSSLTKEQYNNIRTSWQRKNLPIGSAGVIASAYVCPIPYALCDPLGNSPVPGAQQWSDNRVIASQVAFQKKLVFGHSEAAANSNKIIHTGGKLRYTVYTTEMSYTKVSIFLIRPKKKQADQLSVDRRLKAAGVISGAAGAGANLHENTDFTVHNGEGMGTDYDTFYGAEINRKYWDVLYSREIGLNSPKDLTASSFIRTTPNTDGKNNSLVATGTINLPAAGIIKAVGYLTAASQSSSTAMEQQYLDQRNEDSCYLVAISNDLQIDAQNLSMGFVVTDYYKAVV